MKIKTLVVALTLALCTPLAFAALSLGQITIVPSATGGALSTGTVALPTTPAVQTVKTTGGNVYTLACTNTTSALVYPHFFDVVSGSITLGTTAATYTLPPIPANTLGAGYVIPLPSGWQFSNAINYIVSAGSGSTDHATIGAGVSCQAWYF